MEEKQSKRSKIITIVGRILIVLLIFAGVGLYIFADDYYRPSTTATNALKYSQQVTFLEQDGDLIFTPDEIKGGVIIYPGGKVSEKAYGYLAHKIADMGYKTIFWSMAYLDYDVNNQPGKDYVIEHFDKYYHNGAIPLMHNVSESNAQALDTVLSNLTELGYRFVSLDEMFEK